MGLPFLLFVLLPAVSLHAEHRPIPYEFDFILFVERRAGARPCRNVATLPEVTGMYKIKNYMSF